MATHKKFLLVQQEGNREVKRDTSHYNLDISLHWDIKFNRLLPLDLGNGQQNGCTNISKKALQWTMSD